MKVPPEASATCEVAAGILFFTGRNGNRLLMGVDWLPQNMVVTAAPAKIDEYLPPYERFETYRLSGAALKARLKCPLSTHRGHIPAKAAQGLFKPKAARKCYPSVTPNALGERSGLIQ